MDALVKKEAGKGLTLMQVEKPVCKPGHALIKMIKTAICGTDLHIYGWDAWSQKTIKTPQIIGHEFVGIIEEIKGESQFKVGDLVSAEGHIVCKTCKNCRLGKEANCRNTRGIGVNIDGIFAEYQIIPITNLVAANPKIDKNVLAVMDPFGNACHTALMFPLVGEDVLITGAGPIGIMAAAIAAHAGARTVVITDISEYRLQLAKKVCPKCVPVDSKTEKLADVIKKLGIEEGFGVGLEMSGSGIAFNDMIDAMANGGKIALLAIHGPSTVIDWNKVVFKLLTIKGIYGREMYDTWYKMRAMLESGLDISKIITHEFNYKDFEKAFELGLSGKSGKIILNWSK